MELTITQRRENALFERTEVYFTIVHENAGTPRRAEIRKAVAGALGGQAGIVILDWARADFGRTATRGFAKVYKAKERALEVETHPILVRNGLREAVKKVEAAAAPQAPAPAKEEPPKKEASKPEPKPEPKKEEAPAKAEKKEGAPAKKEAAPAKKEAAPAKKEAPAKEKKPAGKKEGK